MSLYKAKSLSGAQSYVRSLLKQLKHRDILLFRANQELQMLAKLASDTPQFYNPIDVVEAKRVRDMILMAIRPPAISAQPKVEGGE